MKRENEIVYLWSYEVCRVAGRHQKPILCPQLLGKSKVTNPDGLWVAQFIHIENITGLQISVHYLNANNTHLTLVWGHIKKVPNIIMIKKNYK